MRTISFVLWSTLALALACQSEPPAAEAPEQPAAAESEQPAVASAEQAPAPPAAAEHPCPYKRGLAGAGEGEPECPMAKAAREAGEPECPMAKAAREAAAAAGGCGGKRGPDGVCECPPDKPNCKCADCPDDCECKGGDKPCPRKAAVEGKPAE